MAEIRITTFSGESDEHGRPLLGDEHSQTPKSRSTFVLLVILGLSLVILGAVAGATFASDSGSSSASDGGVKVYYNAKIYTVNVYNPLAQAMAIKNGKFVAVGTDSELTAQYPYAARQSMNGATVIPGLIDAHAHLMNLGLSRLQAELYNLASVPAVVQTLVNFSTAHPNSQWLLGRGWDQTLWTPPNFPTKEDLDTAFPTLPVWLKRVDGHAGWANSAAIRAAGPIPDQDPLGGEIYRDENGDPTGIFVDSAMDIIDSVVPPYTPEELYEATLIAVQECNRYGLTGVHEAGVSPDYVNTYKKVIDDGKFTLRNYAMFSSCGTTYCGSGQMLFDYDYEEWGPLLNVKSVKLYVDGALGSYGANMIEPYSDNPNTTGLFFFNSTSDLDNTVEAWALQGWQVNSHCIGDRANQVILTSYEKAIQKDESRGGPGRQLRHRIEHTQIIQPEDVIRMGQIGIIPSMQPTHATSDMRWAPDRLGPDRLDEAYPWSTALNASGVIALGSDFPVEYVDPMLGFYAAITRQNASGWPVGGWLPEFRLTRPQTLKGFTLDAAYAAFQEKELGTIAVGKWADFVVLSQDIMDESANPTDILNTKVLSTYLAGRRVYAAP